MQERRLEAPTLESRVVKGEDLERFVQNLRNLKEEYHIGNPIVVLESVEAHEPLFTTALVSGNSSYVDLPKVNGIDEKNIAVILSRRAPIGGYWLTGEEFSRILHFSEATFSWNDGVRLDLRGNLLRMEKFCEHSQKHPFGKKSRARRVLEKITT